MFRIPKEGPREGFPRRVDAGRRPVVKIIAESLSQHDEKHVVTTPLSGIRVGDRKMPECSD
jgi:hypothetical protein